MRIAIVGNSGSGKTTLARQLARTYDAAVLDLDSVAWEPGQIAVARDPVAALADVHDFCASHERWIVEGCYGTLIDAALGFGPHLLFLDPGVERCLANCRERPWEPHKYGSSQEQYARLQFLLTWVREYYERAGEMSHATHFAAFTAYEGPKRHITTLPDAGFTLGSDVDCADAGV